MLRKNIILTLLLAAFIMQSHTIFSQAAQPAQSKLLTTFNFEMITGGIVLVTARLDNYADTLNFILDTGSGGISLDSTTVDALGVITVMSDKQVKGIGGIKRVAFAKSHTLHLSGLTVDSLDFHINDYDLISSVYGVRIDGIIGYSFFRRFIVTLDYDIKEMSVYTPGIFEYAKKGVLLNPKFTTIPIQQLNINDGRAINHDYYFDTGAGLCVLLSDRFNKDSVVVNKKRTLYPTQAEGLGGKKPMELTVVKQVNLGPYKFKKVPAYLFKDEYNVTSYPAIGGLLGNDILRRFNIVINYPAQQIYLKPNTHFNDPFDYSYSGLGVYMVDDKITIVDVIAGSPGQKGGFKTGDIIIGVDSNLSNNIRVYKDLLQQTGKNLSVLIIRNEKMMILNLRVANILK